MFKSRFMMLIRWEKLVFLPSTSALPVYLSTSCRPPEHFLFSPEHFLST